MIEKTIKSILGGMLLGCLIIGLVIPASGEEAKTSDKKVATVNGTNIYQKDLDRDVNAAKQQFQAQGRTITEDQEDQFRQSVLENLIGRELLYQDSIAKKYKMDDKVLSEAMEQLKSRFEKDPNFKTNLEQEGLTQVELEAKLKQGLIIQNYITSLFAEKTIPNEQEAKDFYQQNLRYFAQPEQIKASHILKKVEPSASKDDIDKARKEIEAIRKEALKGTDFSTLATKYSDGPSKSQGGDLGYFGRGRMVKPFDDAAFSMKVGEISEVVQTQFGFHIIKVTDRKEAGNVPYETARTRILDYLRQQNLARELGSYVEELKKTAKVEIFLPTKQ